MEAEKRLELYRAMYAEESSARNDLNEGINGILTVATILGGAAVFLLDAAPPVEGGAWRTLFLVGVSSGTVLLIIALALLITAWTGFQYRYVADAKQLEGWWRDIGRYDLLFPHDEYERGGVPSATIRFQRVLIDQFVEATHFNHRTNRRKGRFADWSKIALSWAALAFAGAMVPHYIVKSQPDIAGGRSAAKENTSSAAPAAPHGAGERRRVQTGLDSVSR